MKTLLHTYGGPKAHQGFEQREGHLQLIPSHAASGYGVHMFDICHAQLTPVKSRYPLISISCHIAGLAFY